MIRWFRRRRPNPVPSVDAPSLLDAMTIAAWGLTRHDWRKMNDQRRAWHRMNITKAPHFPS
jgi:hypothetical protein